MTLSTFQKVGIFFFVLLTVGIILALTLSGSNTHARSKRQPGSVEIMKLHNATSHVPSADIDYTVEKGLFKDDNDSLHILASGTATSGESIEMVFTQQSSIFSGNYQLSFVVDAAWTYDVHATMTENELVVDAVLKEGDVVKSNSKSTMNLDPTLEWKITWDNPGAGTIPPDMNKTIYTFIKAPKSNE